jgi:hypothetical protein
MLCPPLLSRMEERNDLAGRRIQGSDIAPFVAVTEHTGERQVAKRCGTTVFAGKDVINLIADIAVVLVDQTILTAAPSPAAYLLAYSR